MVVMVVCVVCVNTYMQVCILKFYCSIKGKLACPWVKACNRFKLLRKGIMWKKNEDNLKDSVRSRGKIGCLCQAHGVLFVLVAVAVVCLGLSVSQKVLLHCEGVRQRSNEKGDEMEGS